MTDEAEETLPTNLPHALDYVAMVGAIGPFLFSYRTSHSETLNGVVTSSYEHNWTALIGGVVALLFGALTLTLIRATPAEARAKRIGLTAGLIVLAVVHLVVRSGFVL